MTKRTTRQVHKRKLEQVIKKYDDIEKTLSAMFIIYNEVHPHIGANIALLLEANEQLKNAVDRFNKTI